ncbi:MAG TPA: pitrilysin family protein [Bacteroidales bacterium]|nr:pitrilysin family protein [Bacteroidales bacterium]HPS71516.1 pitrilysin family protein [Bacteroidales bacterium]
MAISFKRYILKNGLTLIVHEDHTTPLASCHIVYKVGSRDENSERTGMAHLLEHFMFCGSQHIPDYDIHLQNVGAINNAYTSQDITCYYITLPANNIETALWLESDRMLSLAFDQEQLDIQKHVVMEEFKENFLNRPFGDMWILFNQFVFQKHPYQWLPIGKNLEHIETTTMDDIRGFYNQFYVPNNAVIAISGDVFYDNIVNLVEKWFGDIPRGEQVQHKYILEAEQKESRKIEFLREVPYDMIMKGWSMCERKNPQFYAFDLLSDMLGSGQSSYLYETFVLDQKLFTDITSYITSTNDPGVFVIMGRPADGVSLEEADQALTEYLYHFTGGDNLDRNLQKVKNRVESLLLNNEIKAEDRGSTLAVSEAFGSIEEFENEKESYFAVTNQQIIDIFKNVIVSDKENTIFYRKKS